jgi:hypothetical protein
MVLEVSVHIRLALLFLGCDGAEHHGGEPVVEQNSSPHGDRETERKTGKGCTASSDLCLPSWPRLLALPPPPNSPLSHEFINGLIHS